MVVIEIIQTKLHRLSVCGRYWIGFISIHVLIFPIIDFNWFVAIPAYTHFLVVRQFWKRLLELRALITYGCATFSTVVLPVHHRELALTNETEVDLWVDPYGPLSLLELINPKIKVELLKSLLIEPLILRKLLFTHLNLLTFIVF